jgi:3-hydroxyacyl-[acyl-carrier-protein] dehydratase
MHDDAFPLYRASLGVPVAHRAFAGHFPGHPILPGALLLQRVMSLAETSAIGPLTGCRLSNIKFLAAVDPGDRLQIELVSLGSLDYKFTVHSVKTVDAADVLVCSGRLRLLSPAG